MSACADADNDDGDDDVKAICGEGDIEKEMRASGPMKSTSLLSKSWSLDQARLLVVSFLAHRNFARS